MVSDDAASSSSPLPRWPVSGATPEGVERPAESVPLSAETVRELISNARRRAVVRHVAALDDEERVGMGELAALVDGIERACDPDAVA